MDERSTLLQLLGRLSKDERGRDPWRSQTLHRIQGRLAELGVPIELPAAAAGPSPRSTRRRRRHARVERAATAAGHAWASRCPASSAAPRPDAAAWVGRR